LIERLQPVFLAVNSYIAKLGDLSAIFDREFAFIHEGTDAERNEVNELTFQAERILYLETEVTKLACVTVIRFGSEVEKAPNPFLSKRFFRDGNLSARLILLVEHLRKKRIEYTTV
jgi:hypothetical protein